MTQRTAIIILAALCLILAGYLVIGSLLIGLQDAGSWEKATRSYVEEYHRWLSESPWSGWARLEALAAGPELSRIERLRRDLQDRNEWRYAGGDYRLLLQAGGKALVEADYWLDGGDDKRDVHETYLLEKTLQGIRVIKVMEGGSDDAGR